VKEPGEGSGVAVGNGDAVIVGTGVTDVAVNAMMGLPVAETGAVLAG
jgi:hypothetical protein